MTDFDQRMWESTLRSAKNVRQMMDNLLSRYPVGSAARKELEILFKEPAHD